MALDSKTASTVGGCTVAAAAFFALGHWWGGSSVLESTKLQAENEILYQLVTVQSTAPSQDLMNAADTVCDQEQDNVYDVCMKDFLDRYGDVWVVNLVEGTRVLLTPENAQDQNR